MSDFTARAAEHTGDEFAHLLHVAITHQRDVDKQESLPEDEQWSPEDIAESRGTIGGIAVALSVLRSGKVGAEYDAYCNESLFENHVNEAIAAAARSSLTDPANLAAVFDAKLAELIAQHEARSPR